MVKNLKVAVIGAGSWGTAIANLLACNKFDVALWALEEKIKEDIEKDRENKIFLPDIKLEPNIFVSNDLEDCIKGKDYIFFVVPTHFTRDISLKVADFIKDDALIISASKGIENKTHLLITQIIKSCIPKIKDEQLVAFSGPSFAREVALKKPTAVSIASQNIEAAKLVQKMTSNLFFRGYTSNDIIGVQLGGAVKNVIAITSGILDGLDLGLDARAAIITRGMVEIRRLGAKLGANPETFSGLSGIGDLILTCTGNLSRNYTLGKKIGEGQKLNDILSNMKMVAEGVKTAKSVFNFSRKLDVEMPISHITYKILYEDFSPKKAVEALMGRSLKSEHESF